MSYAKDHLAETLELLLEDVPTDERHDTAVDLAESLLRYAEHVTEDDDQ